MCTFTEELDRMNDDVTDILGEAVTLFKPNVDSGFNFTTGARSITYTKINCNASLRPIRPAEFAMGTGGKGRQLIYVFECRAADISGTPSTEWRICQGTDADVANSMEIVGVEVDSNSTGYVIEARRNA